jgi:hypothetical protein
MPELNHLSAAPAIGVRTRLRFAPSGFVRTILAPVGLLAAAFAAVAVSGRQWGHLVAIAAAAPVAVLLVWAMTTHAAARRGRPIHRAAAVVALVVIWAGILAGLAGCGLALFAPAVLGLTPAGGAR